MTITIDQARAMARIKAREAAPCWGIEAKDIQYYCVRGMIPGAVRMGKHWYVTPAGMDALFMKPKKRRIFKEVIDVHVQ